MVDINSITLKNNAMFNIVMKRPELCKKCLERILNKKISEINYIDSEVSVDEDVVLKSIRLDIYCESEDTAYDVELQNGIYEDLPRRCRYYQDMIDIELLEKGQDYSELKNSIIIFICTFDEFKCGRHLYTFENRCLQDTNISLDDHTTKIFLNTKGTMDDIPKPLKNFLEYIDNGTVNDDLTQDLDDAVKEVRKDKRWRNKLMTVEEYAKATAKQAAKEASKEATEATTERINLLNQKLFADDRIDDLRKSTEDKDFQHQLMVEYGIIDEQN